MAEQGAERTYSTFWLDQNDWTISIVWILTLSIVAMPIVAIVGALAFNQSQRIAVQQAIIASKQRETAAQQQIQEQQNELRARSLQAQAKDAELKATRAAANEQGDLLQRVNEAVATGNMETVKLVLTGAILQTEEIAGAQADQAVQPIVEPEAADVRRIVDDKPVYAITRSPVPRGQAVYIQFAGTLTRAQITALNQGLRDAGWRAQGASGERTPTAAPYNEVRFSGPNADSAKALADALNSAREARAQAPVVPVRIGIKYVPTIRPNVLEVWISN